MGWSRRACKAEDCGLLAAEEASTSISSRTAMSQGHIALLRGLGANAAEANYPQSARWSRSGREDGYSCKWGISGR